jgi:hypothetical protein
MKKFIALLLAFAAVLTAQTWSVKLLPPPPEQFFIEQMWNCTVTNPEGEAVDVRLYGWITHEGAEIAHARSNVINIPAGTRRITSADISSVEDEWYDPAYEGVAERRGALPAGTYQYCIRVERDPDLNELARDCREHRGVTPSAVRLIFPADGSVLTDPQPIFIWAPLVPLAEGTIYRLRIVKVPAEMTPDEAISAAEPWFEQPGITSTTLRYPTEARPLEEGSVYAWQVNAWVGERRIGESEVWYFSIGAPTGLMTREEAIKIIITEVIDPPTLDHDVTAFLGLEMLNPGDSIWPFYGKDKLRIIEAPTWFSWINDDPQAFFEHDTRYVFINAITRKVAIVTEGWWPVLNSTSLWMSDEEWDDPLLVIYSDVLPGK